MHVCLFLNRRESNQQIYKFRVTFANIDICQPNNHTIYLQIIFNLTIWAMVYYYSSP